MQQLLKTLEEKGGKLFDASDVLCAYLYGSHARGEALAQSDIDIAVLVRRDFPEDHLIPVNKEHYFPPVSSPCKV